MGTWIEIFLFSLIQCAVLRRALMGTWIEILSLLFSPIFIKVVPSWARGLKFRKPRPNLTALKVVPSWARGLKYALLAAKTCRNKVVPSWARGLK